MHTNTHAHTHIHTHTHACMHTCRHTHTHTNKGRLSKYIYMYSGLHSKHKCTHRFWMAYDYFGESQGHLFRENFPSPLSPEIKTKRPCNYMYFA